MLSQNRKTPSDLNTAKNSNKLSTNYSLWSSLSLESSRAPRSIKLQGTTRQKSEKRIFIQFTAVKRGKTSIFHVALFPTLSSWGVQKKTSFSSQTVPSARQDKRTAFCLAGRPESVPIREPPPSLVVIFPTFPPFDAAAFNLKFIKYENEQRTRTSQQTHPGRVRACFHLIVSGKILRFRRVKKKKKTPGPIKVTNERTYSVRRKVQKRCVFPEENSRTPVFERKKRGKSQYLRDKSSFIWDAKLRTGHLAARRKRDKLFRNEWPAAPWWDHLVSFVGVIRNGSV